MIDRFCFAALVSLTVAACDGSGRYVPAGSPPPSDVLARERAARPEVVSLSLSPSPTGAIDVILRFSQPMNRNSVETAMSVVAAASTIRSGADGTPLTPLASYSWRGDDREVLFQVENPQLPLVLTIEIGALGKNGLELDGAAAIHPSAEIGTYHRYEDDGFSGPATYVSLPFYPGGSAQLETHPQFLLSNYRPRLVCFDMQFEDPVSSGNLGTWSEGAFIDCMLHDVSFVPERSGVVERREVRLWDPGHMPTATFRSGDREVAATLALGSTAIAPAPNNRIFTIVDDVQLTLTDFQTQDGTDLQGLYLVPADRSSPKFVVTDTLAPNRLILGSVLHSGVGSQDAEDNFVFNDANGQAWIADEFLGQILRRDFDNATASIAGNAANSLALNSEFACADCTYEIRASIGGRFSPGSNVRLTSDRFTVRPVETLTSGEWRLHIDGGQDLLGMALTDGERDGDEVGGRVDDEIVFTLTVP